MSAEPFAEALFRDKSRQAARISGDYFFRFLRLIADARDGDMIHAIVFFAIAHANTSHLDATSLGEDYASSDSPPADEDRRPISALAVAQSLGMPFETTRRHVNRLIDEGVCRRVKGGIIVTQAAVDTPSMRAAAVSNLQNIRRFVRDLRRADID